MDLLATNHRYFELPGEIEVDPLFEYHRALGKEVQRVGRRYTRPYPATIAQALISQLMRKQSDLEHRAVGKDQAWFNLIVWRLARRLGLAPDAFGTHRGATDSQSNRALKQRRGFEGLLRALVPRFKEQSDEHWKTYLKHAIRTEFSHISKSEAINIVRRIQDPHGPKPPRRHMFSPRQRIEPIEPDMSGYRQDSQ